MSTRKRYNKKHLGKTLSKNNYKRMKIQRGGVECQLPHTINLQTSYLDKSNNIKVNNKAYKDYINECMRYAACVFRDIDNSKLISGVLSLINDIGSFEVPFKYKNLIVNEKIIDSTFLDIYVTSLLEKYLGFQVIDKNTMSFKKEDYDFIINEDTNLAIKVIISKLINLEDKFLVKSLLQICSDTFKILNKDSELVKNHAIYSGQFDESGKLIHEDVKQEDPYGDGNLIGRAINTSNELILSIIKIFLFSFSKYINTLNVNETNKKSYNLLILIYKVLFIYTIKLVGDLVTDNVYYEKHLLPIMNDDNLDKFITGETYHNVESLPIFVYLNTAFTIIGCIVNSLLQPEKLDELCNKLDGYLTKNEPFGGAWDIFWNIKFITDGCKINLGKAIIFLGVLTQIYNILLAKIYKYINS